MENENGYSQIVDIIHKLAENDIYGINTLENLVAKFVNLELFENISNLSNVLMDFYFLAKEKYKYEYYSGNLKLYDYLIKDIFKNLSLKKIFSYFPKNHKLLIESLIEFLNVINNLIIEIHDKIIENYEMGSVTKEHFELYLSSLVSIKKNENDTYSFEFIIDNNVIIPGYYKTHPIIKYFYDLGYIKTKDCDLALLPELEQITGTLFLKEVVKNRLLGDNLDEIILILSKDYFFLFNKFDNSELKNLFQQFDETIILQETSIAKKIDILKDLLRVYERVDVGKYNQIKLRRINLIKENLSDLLDHFIQNTNIDNIYKVFSRFINEIKKSEVFEDQFAEFLEAIEKVSINHRFDILIKLIKVSKEMGLLAKHINSIKEKSIEFLNGITILSGNSQYYTFVKLIEVAKGANMVQELFIDFLIAAKKISGNYQKYALTDLIEEIKGTQLMQEKLSLIKKIFPGYKLEGLSKN